MDDAPLQRVRYLLRPAGPPPASAQNLYFVADAIGVFAARVILRSVEPGNSSSESKPKPLVIDDYEELVPVFVLVRANDSGLEDGRVN